MKSDKFCSECENWNYLPKYEEVIETNGSKLKVRVCRYCGETLE